MSDPRQELEELRRLDELERKAASQDIGEIRKAKERTNANIYAGEDVGAMGSIMRGLGGAKHAWDQAAYGLKGLFTDLSSEEKAQLEQGKAFVNQGGTAAKMGEVGGDIAMTAAPALRGAQALQVGAKMLPRAAQFLGGSLPSNMIASGVTSAALTPEDRGSAAMGGALGAGAGELAGRVLTKTLGGLASGAVTPEARRLMDQGINVPMWKATDNKIVRDLAERAKVLPVAGNVLRGQERTAFEDFNKAMATKATPPMPILDDAGNVLRWETKPVKEVGSGALNTLRSRFDDAYGALYGNRGVPVDNAFNQEIGGIVEGVKRYYPSEAEGVQGIVNKVIDTLTAPVQETVIKSGGNKVGGGLVSANMTTPITTTSVPGREVVSHQAIKTALDEVEKSLSSAWRAGNAEKAEALMAVRDSIDALRLRGLPPEVASEAASINKAYASFKQLERATGSLGAQKAGMTSPAQLLNAIKANDRSPGKSRFARGNALNQEETLLADQVLGSRLPETGPGTAEKLAPLLMFGGPMVLGDMGATALLGTKTGQRALMGQLPGQAGIRKYGNEYLIPALRAYGQAQGN